MERLPPNIVSSIRWVSEKLVQCAQKSEEFIVANIAPDQYDSHQRSLRLDRFDKRDIKLLNVEGFSYSDIRSEFDKSAQ